MMRSLVALCFVALVATPACLDTSEPDPVLDDVAERAGPIVCIAYPCCGDLVCDEGETCVTCPVDCGCLPGEICAADTSSETAPGADAVCLPDIGLPASGDQSGECVGGLCGTPAGRP
jgi:hypothetical protein